MPDPIFADPRLAAIYDALDPDRSDLDLYAALVAELGARSVLDIGCGTGTFACLLAAQGLDVIGVDPAEASLGVARAKPSGDRVRWLLGDATALPFLAVDVATMTGNVAQVLLTDDDWAATLAGIRTALRPGGHLVFEVRDPEAEAWRGWTKSETFQRVTIPAVGVVEQWVDHAEATGALVSFRWTYWFERTGETVTSDSTLRFRTRAEIKSSLATARLNLVEVRGAPDRPGLELVFIAQRPDG